MKIKRILVLFIVVLCIGLLTSCDMITGFIESRTRHTPLIQIFNSNLEQTRKMIPNDTLYVKVQGLEGNKPYVVQCLDPFGKVISEIYTMTDEEGTIGMSALWYDIGFEVDEDGVLMMPEDLTVSAFNIRVVDLNESVESRGITDFKLPFWFITNEDDSARPQPIVMAGKRVVDDGTFSVENAFYSVGTTLTSVIYPDEYEGTPLTNTLYVQVAQFEPLREVSDGLNDPVRIWILPFSGASYEPGTQISGNALFYIDFTVQALITASEEEGVLIPWPVIQPTSTINVDETDKQDEIPIWAEGQAFSVFLDMMDDGEDSESAGRYDVKQEGTESFYLDNIDGNGVAGFIVKEPPEVFTGYIPLQLASGGMYRWVSGSGYDYDYRDEFKVSGLDTKYSSHSGIFWGKGVKVIWNPYQTPAGWQASGYDMPSNFWGRYVDVYIVDASLLPFSDGDTITPATGTYRSRLPVQYGCSNGYWQQTIWRAPMTLGEYVLVVDMDLSGTITDDDLVDDISGTDGVGFTVVSD